MERIRLARNEKKVLRMVAAGHVICLTEYPSHTFSASVRSLEGKGFVRGAYEEGGNVVDVMITPVGRLYIAKNPSLRNLISWKWIVTAAIAFAVLFIFWMALSS